MSLCALLALASVGIIPTASAAASLPYLAQNVVGDLPRFEIVPSLNASYDTNARPFVSRAAGGSRGNGRISPGVDILAHRFLGSIKLDLTGSFGYDFNTRYKYLNQPRLSTIGNLGIPVSSKCDMNLDAVYRRYRLDSIDAIQAVNATSRSENYRGVVNCERAVGISPFAGVSYAHESNDASIVYNYETFAYFGGISYLKPSLGTVSLTGSIKKISRPKIRSLLGVSDDTKILDVSGSIARAISPRIQVNASLGYVHANPTRDNVKAFSGLSFNINTIFKPSPRLSISASASRDLDNQNGVNATYTKVDEYSLAIHGQVSQPSSFDLTTRRSYRKFNGETLVFPVAPVFNDTSTDVGLRYNLLVLRRYKISAGVRHLWRNSKNTFYDYQSTIFSTSIGARF